MAGGCIYLFLRPGEFIFQHWLEAIGLGGWSNPNGSSGTILGIRIPDWILYSLPNGLWAFAYTLFIAGNWLGSPSRLRYFWFATVPVLVLGFEFLQGADVIRGTFSFMDLGLGIAGLITGTFIAILLKKHRSP